MRPSLAILALGDADRSAQGLFLVAPDFREDDVRA